ECNTCVRDMVLGIPRVAYNSIGMKLVYIPAGEFQMGTHDEDEIVRANERPRHLVRITKPFYMGAFTVSQEEFQRVVGKNPSWFVAQRMGTREQALTFP